MFYLSLLALNLKQIYTAFTTVAVCVSFPLVNSYWWHLHSCHVFSHTNWDTVSDNPFLESRIYLKYFSGNISGNFFFFFFFWNMAVYFMLSSLFSYDVYVTEVFWANSRMQGEALGSLSFSRLYLAIPNSLWHLWRVKSHFSK